MHYVYILQSIADPEQFYTGLCADVQQRLAAHNAGQSPHTSKFKPWRLVSMHYFSEPSVAAAFERYLKSGSGRAFAAKRLRAPAFLKTQGQVRRSYPPRNAALTSPSIRSSSSS